MVRHISQPLELCSVYFFFQVKDEGSFEDVMGLSAGHIDAVPNTLNIVFPQKLIIMSDRNRIWCFFSDTSYLHTCIYKNTHTCIIYIYCTCLVFFGYGIACNYWRNINNGKVENKVFQYSTFMLYYLPFLHHWMWWLNNVNHCELTWMYLMFCITSL